ncbi:MAG: RHS repeat-associated core domain-containing protein [Chloroflexia bacterium]
MTTTSGRAGSVAALTDSAGNLAATYSYEPFGKLKSSTGSLANPYRWLGALGVYHDAPTGLYKMGTRYYDPALGRFTQTDPIEGGSANAYDYALQDPINETDVDGTCVGRFRVFRPVCTKAAKLAEGCALGRT